MNRLRKITRRLKRSRPVDSGAIPAALRASVLQARRAYYAEDYEAALKQLDEVLPLVDPKHTAALDVALTRVDILIAQGNTDEASIQLTNLIDQNDLSFEGAAQSYTYVAFGLICQKQGDLDNAQKWYEKARKLAESIPTDGAAGRAIGHLAELAFNDNNASYALHLLNLAIPKLIRSGDKELLGYFHGLLGKAMIASGHEADGIKTIKRGLELAKNIKHIAHIRTLYQYLGDHALLSAQFEDAYKYYAAMLDHFPNQTQESLEAIQIYSNIAYAAIRNQLPDEASEYAQRILSMSDALDIADQTIYRMQAVVALAHHMQGTHDALTALQQARVHIEDDVPLQIEIVCAIAEHYTINGNLEAAIQACLDALELVPVTQPLQSAVIYERLGTLEKNAGNFTASLKYWQQALTIHSDADSYEPIPSLHCQIGDVHLHVGDGRAAKRAFDNALTLLSKIKDAVQRGRVLEIMGIIHTEFGDISSAESYFKDAIDIAKRENDTRTEIKRRVEHGRLLALSSKPKSALATLQIAAQKLRDFDSAKLTAALAAHLGLAQAALNEHETALGHFTDGLAHLNNDIDEQGLRATIYIYRGYTYLNLSQFDKAQVDFETAYTIAEEYKHVPLIARARIGIMEVALNAGNLKLAETILHDIESIVQRTLIRRDLLRLYVAKVHLYQIQGKHEEIEGLQEEIQTMCTILRMPQIAYD